MNKLISFFKNSKICDLISLTGVAAFAAIFLFNVIKYAVLANPVAFLAAFTVSALFLLCAVFTWRSRLPAVWLLMGLGSVVLLSCTNFLNYYPNSQYIAQFFIALAVGIVALVFQFRERAKPKMKGIVSLSLLLAVAIFAGGFWWGSTIAVSNKNAPAQMEVWTVPDKYDKAECPNKGTLEKIEYQTRAYGTDRREVTKSAYVYLPYGYDESKQYNILYLLHGTGDDEAYWLKNSPENKTMIDNLIYYKDIEPLIVVTPTWYVEDDLLSEQDRLTYSFLAEFTFDLMPYVEARYSTYAEDVSLSSLRASRDHRAFAGLSRGSFTVYRSILNGCLDYVSWFGAYSGFMTNDNEFEMGMMSDRFKDYSINYLYNTSGSFDFLLSEHLSGYRHLLEMDDRLIQGKNCSFDVFPMSYHSIQSWQIALYNSLQLFFTD